MNRVLWAAAVLGVSCGFRAESVVESDGVTAGVEKVDEPGEDGGQADLVGEALTVSCSVSAPVVAWVVSSGPIIAGNLIAKLDANGAAVGLGWFSGDHFSLGGVQPKSEAPTHGISDLVVAHVDSEGNVAWLLVGGGASGDEFTSLDAEDSGAFVGGGSFGSGKIALAGKDLVSSHVGGGEACDAGCADAFLLTGGVDGTVDWGPSIIADEAASVQAVRFGGGDKVFVAGSFWGEWAQVGAIELSAETGACDGGFPAFLYDGFVARFNAHTWLVDWALTVGGPCSNGLVSLAPAATGGIYVAGGFTGMGEGLSAGGLILEGTCDPYLGTGGCSNAFVLKLDDSGAAEEVWKQGFDTYPPLLDDFDDGSVVVAGGTRADHIDVNGKTLVNHLADDVYPYGDSYFPDDYVFLLNSQGEPIWMTSTESGAPIDISALAVDPFGGTWFAGQVVDGSAIDYPGCLPQHSSGSCQGAKLCCTYAVVHLAKEGDVLWSHVFPMPCGSSVSSLDIGSDGAVLMGGVSPKRGFGHFGDVEIGNEKEGVVWLMKFVVP